MPPFDSVRIPKVLPKRRKESILKSYYIETLNFKLYSGIVACTMKSKKGFCVGCWMLDARRRTSNLFAKWLLLYAFSFPPCEMEEGNVQKNYISK